MTRLSNYGKSEMCMEKLREYLPILTGKGFSLKFKGEVYTSIYKLCKKLSDLR